MCLLGMGTHEYQLKFCLSDTLKSSMAQAGEHQLAAPVLSPCGWLNCPAAQGTSVLRTWLRGEGLHCFAKCQ